ncbi:MAG: hypothetical protein M0R06_06215 [Sphaerochaeta sp.]|jgi:crossover junction endodeoxyribonuclease RuvC|nr:hypothetical protein [Sphaerochaeta sp.]
MTIIAIDPSLTATGIVVLIDGQVASKTVVKTKPTNSDEDELKRLISICDEVWAIVQYHADRKPVAVIEAPAFCAVGTSLVQLSGLNFMLRDRFYDWKIPLLVVSPMTLKKFASGKGNSKKEDMKLAAFKRWGFEDRDNNIVDAFCLAKLAECRIGNVGTKEDLNTVAKAQWIKP